MLQAKVILPTHLTPFQECSGTWLAFNKDPSCERKCSFFAGMIISKVSRKLHNGYALRTRNQEMRPSNIGCWPKNFVPLDCFCPIRSFYTVLLSFSSDAVARATHSRSRWFHSLHIRRWSRSFLISFGGTTFVDREFHFVDERVEGEDRETSSWSDFGFPAVRETFFVQKDVEIVDFSSEEVDEGAGTGSKARVINKERYVCYDSLAAAKESLTGA